MVAAVHCGACGRDLEPGARFCDRCGRSVAGKCAGCGRAAAPDATFCAGCGAPLDGGAGLAPQATGEVRTLSVVFADMSGSVAAAHGLDPEASTEHVNAVLQAMVSTVSAHGGTVDRFLGDGLLALFGTPHAHEDDPVRAVAAALELCERVRDLGMQATAGVHTGAVYLGPVGSELHRETTAMGDVVNLAARLQGQAAPGAVLVSAATQRHISGAFDLTERMLDIKGVPDPMQAYEVAGRRERPQRAPRPDGARAPTMGRDAELAQLRAAVASLEDGHGGVALVIGDPGLGKSRLVSETIAAASHARVLEGRCLESGTASYWPFADALRAHFAWASDADGEERIATIERECERLAAAGRLVTGEGDSIIAAVATLLGIRDRTTRGEAWASMPAGQRQRQTFAAVRALLVALATERPLLLVVEDLHWSDALSIGLVSSLLDDAATSPLLVVCTYRPVREHACWRLGTLAAQRFGDRSIELALRDLTVADAERIVSALLGVAEIAADVRELVIARAQGNPLYLEEVVRSAIDTGVLVPDRDGSWSVSDRTPAASVPDTLERLVRARVDRLPHAHRRVLQLAAVLGRLFSPSLLEQLLPAGDDVRGVLAELDHHDLVYQERLLPDEEWTFKHVLVRETIYQSILRRDRAALHGRVVAALEAADPARMDERASALAHHAALAGHHERAYRYLRLAGMQATTACLNEAAIDLFTQAIEHADAADIDEADKADVHERLGDVVALLGRHDDARAAFKSAIALAPEPSLAAARVHRKLAKVHVTVRAYEEAISELDAGERAIQGRPTPSDEARWTEWIEQRFDRARLHYWRSEPDRIAEIVDGLEAAVDAHGTAHFRVDMKTLRVMQLLRQQRYHVDAPILQLVEESVQLSRDDPDLAFRAFTRFNSGFVHLWARDLDHAMSDLDAAREIADRAGDVITLSRCHTYLAFCHRFRGDVESCGASVAAAVAVAGASAMVEYLGAARANLAWIALRDGRRDDVAQLAHEAFDLWDKVSLVYAFQWAARFPLLAVALADGDVDEARRQAKFMCGPNQQSVSPDIDALLAAATDESLAAAVALARPLGYT